MTTTPQDDQPRGPHIEEEVVGLPWATRFSRRAFLGISAVAAVGTLFVRRVFDSVGRALDRYSVPVPWHRQGAVELTYTTCDMCPWRCGVVVKTVDGVVRKIDGNPADPKSRGMLCARGQAGPSFLYDPDRLTTPTDPRL